MDPTRRATSWQVGKPLDLSAMRLASDPFIGEHDFAAFARRPKGLEGPITRRVTNLGWDQVAPDHLRFEIEASAFAHQMVRSIVGALVAVGEGRIRTNDIVRFLRSASRSGVPTLAPPGGLTLIAVEYPARARRTVGVGAIPYPIWWRWRRRTLARVGCGLLAAGSSDSFALRPRAPAEPFRGAGATEHAGSASSDERRRSKTCAPSPRSQPTSPAPGTSSMPRTSCSAACRPEVARILRGKHKPIFAPHLDTGDHVIVVNAAKLVMTANKGTQKMAYRHSGYPGSLRATSYGDLLAKKPEELVRRAVRGMLPKGTLGRQMLGKLKVYAGPDHPHAAQNPARLSSPAPVAPLKESHVEPPRSSDRPPQVRGRARPDPRGSGDDHDQQAALRGVLPVGDLPPARHRGVAGREPLREL